MRFTSYSSKTNDLSALKLEGRKRVGKRRTNKRGISKVLNDSNAVNIPERVLNPIIIRGTPSKTELAKGRKDRKLLVKFTK